MFKRLKKNVFKYAEDLAEVVAPSFRTPLEKFQNHWQRVTDFIVDQSTAHEPSDDTNDDGDEPFVFELIRDMLAMLIDEESDSDGMGPCMEFMLGQNILRTAVSLAQGDFPKGIRAEILKFFTKLLTDISQTLIPHQNVYGPMKKLMAINSVSAPGSRRSLRTDVAMARFLDAVCVKLAQFPGFADLFVDTIKDGGAEPMQVFLPAAMLKPLLLTNRQGGDLSASPLSSPERPVLHSDAFFGGADGVGGGHRSKKEIKAVEITRRSYDCLRVVFTLRSPVVDRLLVADDTLVHFMTQRLVELYAGLPTEFTPGETQEHVMEWIESQFDGWKRFSAAKHERLPADAIAFLAFMDWIHFCDDVIEDCGSALGAHMVDIVARGFLKQQIAPMLLHASEDTAYTSTCYVSACITQISSARLLRGWTTFLLGGSAEAGDGVDNRIADTLIQRCDHVSEDLSAATLHLFLRLLMKRNEHVLDRLVLRHIDDASLPQVASSATLRAAMHIMADRYASMVPASLRSCDDGVSYKEYFIDAQHAVWACRRACAAWGEYGKPGDIEDSSVSPGRIVSNVSSTSSVLVMDAINTDPRRASLMSPEQYSHADDPDDGPDFSVSPQTSEHGGDETDEHNDSTPHGDDVAEADLAQAFAGVPCSSPFLAVLSRRLRQLPTQSHTQNLLITGNYAALFEYPTVALHAILLGTSDGSLFSTFEQLCTELKAKSARIDNIDTRLDEIRHNLVTMPADEARTDSMSTTLRAIIVLEEFSKEVAARLLVQCNEMLLAT
eukprot:m.1178825 g.1178825  ORF g.1178825 m.1178825 type:complete len:779 (-) comp24528_c1_seq3:1892-4228(-)